MVPIATKQATTLTQILENENPKAIESTLDFALSLSRIPKFADLEDDFFHSHLALTLLRSVNQGPSIRVELENDRNLVLLHLYAHNVSRYQTTVFISERGCLGEAICKLLHGNRPQTGPLTSKYGHHSRP